MLGGVIMNHYTFKSLPMSISSVERTSRGMPGSGLKDVGELLSIKSSYSIHRFFRNRS
jgi:hypothetical protein